MRANKVHWVSEKFAIGGVCGARLLGIGNWTRKPEFMTCKKCAVIYVDRKRRK